MNRSALPWVRGVYGLVRFGVRPSAEQASRQDPEAQAGRVGLIVSGQQLLAAVS